MPRGRRATALFAAVSATIAILAAALTSSRAADAERGRQLFSVCAACHAIGPGAQNKVGPELNGLDGRHCGSAANFDYSNANKSSGIVWNEAAFKQYIKDPSAMVPGTKMLFAGIKNRQEINDLWAYVSQFDGAGNIKK